jgi:hypothetical protein
MKEKNIIRYIILIYWVFFTGLTVVDKIIPDVYPYWVGADFYTLFVKFFASLGLTDPIFATIALAGVAALEILAFVCYLFALINQYKAKDKNSEQWFYRGVGLSVLTFSFFSIGDQVFGDRNNLLEHGIFWIILIVSWAVYKYSTQMEERIVKVPLTKDFKIALSIGILLTLITTYSLFNFSNDTFIYKTQPVQGEEVVDGIYKFDFPFLGDKFVMENTIKTFEEKHPELKINYIYTGPDELNTKKKTHILLYIFTEPQK